MNETNGLEHDTSTHLRLRQEFLIRQLQGYISLLFIDRLSLISRNRIYRSPRSK